MSPADTEQGLPCERRECFATTHWSVVLAAGDEKSPRAEQALTELCRAYWYPLYAYLRRTGQPSADAQDAVQGFFAHLLQNQRLARVQPARGKFRSFLLAALRNFLADERRKQNAQKRGGDVTLIPLEADTAEERYRIEPVDARDPGKLFEISGLHIINVSGPADPLPLSRFDLYPGLRFHNVFVAADPAYVANDSPLRFVVDMSDPGNPRRENDFFAERSLRDVSVSGNIACLASPFL